MGRRSTTGAIATKLPDLSVYVQGPGFMPYVRMFNDQPGYKATRDLDAADAICFTGGPDVEPRIYGEETLPKTFYIRDRDKMDRAALQRSHGKLRVGICRGAQFLNVMNGGTLWQHVEGHTVYHDLVDKETGEVVRVTSTHHQEMRPTKSAEILAVANVATLKQAPGINLKGALKDDDIEAVWYNSTKSLCFQPHPEFGLGPDANSTRLYFFNLLERVRRACAA